MKKLFCIVFIFLYVPIHVYCQDSLYFDSTCNRVKSREMAKYYERIIRNSDFVIGQEINYFDVKGKDVKSFESAVSYSIVLHELEFPDRKIEREFALDGKLKVEKQFIDVPNEKEDKKIISKLNGKYKEWYLSGILRRNIDYKKGQFDGDLLTYWDNGSLKRQDKYQDGKLIVGKCFNVDGKEVDFYPYESMPEYPGGEKALLDYISNKVHYPFEAQKSGIQGRVAVRFVVEKTGEIAKIEVIKSVSPELDREAIRVVKTLAKLKPGMQDGELVSVWYTLPISFRLN